MMKPERIEQWAVGALAVILLPTGVQAAFVPRSFFDDFPLRTAYQVGLIASRRSPAVLHRNTRLRRSRRQRHPGRSMDHHRPTHGNVALSLIAEPGTVGIDTGIRFGTTNATDLIIWDDMPPMFSFDDPDHNRFYIIEDQP